MAVGRASRSQSSGLSLSGSSAVFFRIDGQGFIRSQGLLLRPEGFYLLTVSGFQSAPIERLVNVTTQCEPICANPRSDSSDLTLEATVVESATPGSVVTTVRRPFTNSTGCVELDELISQLSTLKNRCQLLNSASLLTRTVKWVRRRSGWIRTLDGSSWPGLFLRLDRPQRRSSCPS